MHWSGRMLLTLLYVAGSIYTVAGGVASYHNGRLADQESSLLRRGISDGKRRLSLVHPTATEDDSVPKRSTTSSTGGNSLKTDDDSVTSASTNKSNGSIATRTSKVGKVKKTSSSSSGTSYTASDGSSRSISSHGAKDSNSSLPEISSLSMISNSNCTFLKSETNANCTDPLLPQQPTDPGEGFQEESHSYYHPLPPVYDYSDDSDESWKSDGINLQHRPLNPVVDDISQFLNDDSYKSLTRIFPKEKEEPKLWPVICLGTFFLAAVALCVTTAVKNYRKRKTYHEIPTSLIV